MSLYIWLNDQSRVYRLQSEDRNLEMNTQQRILESAARLFHEQGYAATGVATILREAGVNSGSLYHFYSSKDALLEGVLSRYLERLYPEIMRPMEQAEADPVARVFHLLGWYRQYLEGNDCRLGCPVGNLALEISDTHPELKHLLAKNFDNWTGIIEGWLVEAGSALPADCDRGELARLVLTVMEGGIMQARAAGLLQPFDQSVNQLKAYFDVLTSKVPTSRAQDIPAPLAQTA
jgi:AcrR family transcriptional regulator